MYPIKLDKGQAASRYGKPFVASMMRDRNQVLMTEDQDRLALRVKAVRDGWIVPFRYEWVYVIHDGNGITKVGRSYTPRKRLLGIQTSTPMDLHFYAAAVFGRGGAPSCEVDAHRHLKTKGCHKRGEWFEVQPGEAFEYIKSVAQKHGGTTELDRHHADQLELWQIFQIIRKDDRSILEAAAEAKAELEWVQSEMKARGR